MIVTRGLVKKQAKLLKIYLGTLYGVDEKLAHCLEIVSRLYGFKDWNTCSASLDGEDDDVSLRELKQQEGLKNG